MQKFHSKFITLEKKKKKKLFIRRKFKYRKTFKKITNKILKKSIGEKIIIKKIFVCI
jgi:hypothetical protein